MAAPNATKAHARLKPPRRRWLLLAVLGAAFAVAVPVAWATFGDVPPDNPFYDDVNAVQGAGITSGCGGGNFCPNDNITRQAEAAFVHRAEPRVAQSEAIDDGLIDGAVDFATATHVGAVSIDVGGVAGGKQFVKVDAHMDLDFDTGTTPVDVAYYADAGDACDALPRSQIMDLTLQGAEQLQTASLSWAAQVPTGTTQTFSLCAFSNGSDAFANALELVATTYPFGSTGGSTLGPTSAATAARKP